MKTSTGSSMKFLASCLMLLLLQACGSDSGGGGQLADDFSTATEIRGVVVKGNLYNATINIYQLDSMGIRITSTPVASTTTDSAGNFTVSVPNNTDTWLVETGGGEYIDEADQEPDINLKRRISFTASEGLQTAVLPGETTMSITVLSYALLEKSRRETTNNNFNEVFQANRNLATSGYGFDPVSTFAGNPVDPGSSLSPEELSYAMLLGGIANTLNTLAISLGEPAPNYAIIVALIEDISDGSLNGQINAQSVGVNLASGPTTLPTDVDINDAIVRFRNNNYSAYSNVPLTTVDESILSGDPFVTSDAGTDTQANAGQTVSLDGTASQGDISGYNWVQVAGPTVTITDSDQAVASFIAPTVSSDTILTFELTVSNAAGTSDTLQVDILITATPDSPPAATPNSPPTANAGSDQSVDEGATVNLAGSGSDSDGSIVGYQWTQVSGTSVSILNSNQVNASFVAPQVGGQEALVLQLVVTDDIGATGASQLTITVNNIPSSNSSPTASAGQDQTVVTLANVDLTGSGSDSDGSVIAYNWVQLTGTTVSLLNADQSDASFTAPSIAATLTFRLTVTDNLEATGSDEVQITITAQAVIDEVRGSWAITETYPQCTPEIGVGTGFISFRPVDVLGNVDTLEWNAINNVFQPGTCFIDPVIGLQTYAQLGLFGPGDTVANLAANLLQVLQNDPEVSNSSVISTPTQISLSATWNSFSWTEVWDKVLTTAGTQKWSLQTGGPVLSSPAIGLDRSIYVGSDDNNIYKISEGGKALWSTAVGTDVRSSPALLLNSVLYIGSSDTNLYALDQSTGAIFWAFQTNDQFLDMPAIANDGSIIATSGNVVYSIDGQGDMGWQFPTSFGELSSPTIGADGTIYVGSDDNFIYAINPVTGGVNWEFQTGNQVESTPAVDGLGNIYFGSNDGNLYALSSSGSLLWSVSTRAAVESSPVIAPSGVVYVGSNDGNLYIVDSQGLVLSTFDTGAPIVSSPSLGADGTIYIGSDNGNLYAINGDGSLKWTFTTNGPIVSSPVVGVDGTIYVGSSDGFIYAINGSSGGPPLSGWPTFGGSSLHTSRKDP